MTDFHDIKELLGYIISEKPKKFSYQGIRFSLDSNWPFDELYYEDNGNWDEDITEILVNPELEIIMTLFHGGPSMYYSPNDLTDSEFSTDAIARLLKEVTGGDWSDPRDYRFTDLPILKELLISGNPDLMEIVEYLKRFPEANSLLYVIETGSKLKKMN